MPVPPPPLPWLERANHVATLARLLSTTVHEVNNALQVISGQAELLASVAGASEAVQRRAQSIGQHARSGSEMLGELLAFARDAGDRTERVALPQIAAATLRLRRYSLNRLGIDAASEAPEAADAWVAGSRRILLQVVLNLVFNAEQALADRPSGALRLRTRRRTDIAELIVEDTGPGLPDDALVWAPDKVSGSNGLGIGLLVAQWLAEQQGGRLYFERPDQGSGCRATLALPAIP